MITSPKGYIISVRRKREKEFSLTKKISKNISLLRNPLYLSGVWIFQCCTPRLGLKAKTTGLLSLGYHRLHCSRHFWKSCMLIKMCYLYTDFSSHLSNMKRNYIRNGSFKMSEFFFPSQPYIKSRNPHAKEMVCNYPVLGFVIHCTKVNKTSM